MKRKTLTIVSLIFVMLISCFGLVACAHKHEFSKQDASEAYLAVEATCTEKAQYYYSCECGEKGTDTFEYGEPLGHTHSELKHSETEHWNECSCGDKADIAAHTGGTATCTAKAVCEVCNTSYGELLAHEYVTTEYKKSEYQHWFECACGAKDAIEVHTGGTATCTEQAICEDCGEDYGALAPHEHDEQKYNETEHWDECVCGDKANVAAHAYTIYKEEGGQKWYECACGAIDERYLIDVDAEILMSLNSKKLFFNKTDLEGAEIIGMTYNGNVILVDGALDVSAFAINQAKPYVLHIETSVNRYALNNVVAYTEVFEDTAESRELMASIFRGREAENGILDGSYALVENLNFNHFALDESGNMTYDKDGNVLYSNKEAFDANTGWKRVIGQDEDGKDITETVKNTFSGTFDGRGYALNNVLMNAPGGSFYGIFGYKAGNGATIKNLAINGVSKFVNKTTVNTNKGYDSLLFHSPESAEAVLTLENVYIYRHLTTGSSNGGVLYYSGGPNVVVAKNVIIMQDNDYEGAKQTSAWYSTSSTKLAAGSSIENLYIVTNSIRAGFDVTKDSTATNYAFYRITEKDDNGEWIYDITFAQKLAEFKAADNDYSGFDAEYWTIVDGIPVWNSINTIVKVENSKKEVVNSINSTTAGEEFVITVESLGDIVKENVQIAIEGDDVIALNGNVVTIKENINGVATITVTYGSFVKAIAVVVDSRVAVEFNEEVLVSKANGKIYLNGTSLKNDVIAYGTVAYGDVTIGGENAVDVSLIVDAEGEQLAVNTKFGLTVVTNNGKYNFTNVKMYDVVFENTKESRLEMVDLFSYYGRTRGYSSYVWNEKNYGYYVLAENITFDLSNIPLTAEDGLANFNPDNIDLKEWAKTAPYELFHNAATVAQANDFGGIFDGRGYSLNNIGLQGSMFGEAQNGAVIKNVAFNGFTKFEATKADSELGWSKVYYNEVGGGTNAKIFSAIASADAEVTFENVYVSDPTTKDNNTYSSLFFYNAPKDANDADSQGKLVMKNVIVEDVSGVVMSGMNDLFDTISDDVTILDTYVITVKSIGRSSETSAPNSRGENIVKYASLADMKAANNNYSTFSSDFWTVAEGEIPVWKTLPVAPAE